MTSPAEHAATVDQARKALADEKWVTWALNETGDLNEGALVYAYRTIVALAARADELEQHATLAADAMRIQRERAERAEQERDDARYTADYWKELADDAQARVKELEREFGGAA